VAYKKMLYILSENYALIKKYQINQLFHFLLARFLLINIDINLNRQTLVTEGVTMSKVISIEQAMEKIQNSSVVMIGGFSGTRSSPRQPML
jgi:hypothetical protein